MDTNHTETPSDDLRLDRLVDGELNEQERRELLAGLDDQPGGWRRCALAFIEAQCWKQSLGLLRGEKRDVTGPTAAILAGPRSAGRPGAKWSGRLGTVLAMAASFFLAFLAISSLHRSRLSQPWTPSGEDAKLVATAPAQQPPVESIRPNHGLARSPGGVQAADNPWRVVTVASPAAADGGAALRVPAVERDDVDQQWVRSLPPAMPEKVLRALNRSGHQVEQHRELVPVPLQDGRQLVMPVDNVKVRYVGNDTF